MKRPRIEKRGRHTTKTSLTRRLAVESLEGRILLTTTFFTDRTQWANSVPGEIDAVDLKSPADLPMATEVFAAPGLNTDLGPILTFDKANTGLSATFEVATLQSGAIYVYGEPDVDPAVALSVGQKESGAR